VFIEQFAKTECCGTFDTTVLAEPFELARARVRTVCGKAPRKQQAPYRPHALSDEQEFELCQMIRDKAVTGNYVTKRESINDIEANFCTNLTYGWIHCFL
jgi:hypothetical protein